LNGDHVFEYEGDISQYVVFTDITKTTFYPASAYTLVETKEFLDYESNGRIQIKVFTDFILGSYLAL